MQNTIFIPTKLNIGFKERNDTYTGRLAYIVYTDQSGKLRQEASWNNWIDKKIEPEEYENTPLSGFVLNKKVGDYSYSWWEHRKAKVRVYDPRNFEFEISIENLLHILENTNSIKGKGLEGDFVYGWAGKELVLLPVDSPDYKKIKEYNYIVHNNEYIKAKDLILGATYAMKDNKNLIYIGRYDSQWHVDEKIEKYYWFAEESIDKKYDSNKCSNGLYYRFYYWKSISKKFISIISNECNSAYPHIYTLLEHTNGFSPYDPSMDKYIPYSFEEFKENIGDIFYAKSNDINCTNYYEYKVNKYGKYFYYEYIHIDNKYYVTINRCYYNNYNNINVQKDYNNRFEFSNIKDELIPSYSYPYSYSPAKYFIPLQAKELYEKLQPLRLQKYLKNGNIYNY